MVSSSGPLRQKGLVIAFQILFLELLSAWLPSLTEWVSEGLPADLVNAGLCTASCCCLAPALASVLIWHRSLCHEKVHSHMLQIMF